MKKLMAVIAAAAVALTLVGCDSLGKGRTSGTKYNTKMTVDGTNITTTYRRFIKQLSTSEKVTDIKSTISVDLTKSTITVGEGTEKKNAVVGLAFDFHTTKATDGTKTFDFVLIGVAPETKKFYIERYEKISAEKAKSIKEEAMKEDEGDSGFDTSDPSMGAGGDPEYVSFSGSFPMKLDKYIANDWKDLPEKSYAATEATFDIYVQIKQATVGTYDVYLGDTKVATYEGTVKCTDAKDTKNNGKCWGGAAVYANTPKGCKVVVKYAQDKKETVGLFADEDEF